MTNEEASLRTVATETAEALTAWRDDIKVRLHLAGMDARDAWEKVEPDVEIARARLRKALDAVVPGGSEAVRLELHLGLAEARERLATIEPNLETLGDDLAKAGRKAIARLRDGLTTASHDGREG